METEGEKQRNSTAQEQSQQNDRGGEYVDGDGGSEEAGNAASSLAKVKRKSKKAKLKSAMGISRDDSGGASENLASKLTPDMMDQLLEMNLSLKCEVSGLEKEKAVEVIKNLDAADLLTGLVRGKR